MESGPRKRVGEVRQNSGGGRRGAGRESRPGAGNGPSAGSWRGRRGPVGGRLRAGLRQPWVRSALESGPSAGGTKICCWLGGGGAGVVVCFFFPPSTGGGLCGQGEGRCHIHKCIFSKSESRSLTGERSGGGGSGSGGNKSWTGLRRNNLEGFSVTPSRIHFPTSFPLPP